MSTQVNKQVDDEIITIMKMLADTALLAAKSVDKTADAIQSAGLVMERIERKLDALAGGRFLKIGDDYIPVSTLSDHPDTGAEVKEKVENR